ncbi:hypothetical protein INR49_023454 [Caranx melampygus]|nr:hypothetical protein INR49_023454 [Caranx melampygus]
MMSSTEKRRGIIIVTITNWKQDFSDGSSLTLVSGHLTKQPHRPQLHSSCSCDPVVLAPHHDGAST